jgi:hypothetical protein
MRKIVFAALVISVAVGGAFASNLSEKELVYGGEFSTNAPCNKYVVDCVPIGTMPCTINLGGNEIVLYHEDLESGKCTIPYYQQEY